MNSQEFEKRLAWISTLKIGDEVAMHSGRYGYANWYIFKVVKITPSGRLKLDNGLAVNTDGSVRGDNFNYIQEVTNEIRVEIWRKRAVSRIHRNLKLEKLTNENLKVILDMVRGIEIE